MVAPLVIAGAIVGAQVVSGIMQYYQSEKAAGANKKRLAEIEAMFNKIVPPEYDISIFDDPRVAQEIPVPDLDFSAITPKDYASVGQHIPEVADYIQETNPKLVEATESAKTGRQAQLDALTRYKQIASGGFDPMLHQRMQEASEKAQADAQSRQQSIMQDAARRGIAGSGLEMASQMQSGSDAMRTSAMQSQLAAAEAYKNQLMALDKSANLGGDIRDSEMGEEARNAEIINSFNQRTRRDSQSWADQRAAVANAANLRNLDVNQRIADANVKQGNDAAWRNADRWNAGQQQNFQNRRTNRDDLLDIAAQKRGVQSQTFADKMNIARSKAGIGEAMIAQNNRRAQDTNQQIRGVGDAVSAGAMYYGANAPQSQAPQYADQPPSGWDGKEDEWGNAWKYKQGQQRY